MVGSTHSYKYRLAYVVSDECVLRYDNEAGKGDHKHMGVFESGYTFIGLPELLREFSNARMLIFGLAMMVMMIWRPQGLLPPRQRRYRVDTPPAASDEGRPA